MISNRGRAVRGLMAGALALALLSSGAMAQVTITGGEVNMSGATLFYDFYKMPAGTNDYIDADGDGFSGFHADVEPYVDQLAPDFTPTTPWSGHWLVQVRGVGSGNGLAELVDYALLGTIPTGTVSEGGLINRLEYASVGGTPTLPVGQRANASGTPYQQTSVDIAVMDVPTKWFVTAGSSSQAAWNRQPTQPGYGTNPRLSDVSSGTGEKNVLKSLSRTVNQTVVSLNTNTGSPDANTVFDTQIAWVPIAFIANRGTGVDNVNMTELQHLYVAGRMPNGENLVGATRDAGSGTRNGAMNSIGVDPSFGIGDNQGKKNSSSAALTLVGANFQANNQGGSGLMEDVVRNSRLAIGYTGLAGGSRAAGDVIAGRYEVLSIAKDIDGDGDGLPDSLVYVRPSSTNVVDCANPATGWQIGGPETFATVGDPTNETSGTTTYMANQAAADYIRNITASAAGFAAAPTQQEGYFMPGEALAMTYFLPPGLTAVVDNANPTLFHAQTPNAALRQYMLDSNTLGVASGTLPDWGTVNPAGQVPARTVLTGGATYSDGQTGDYRYYDSSNVLRTIGAGKRLSARNDLAGDFNNDGLRNADDAATLVGAVLNPAGFERGVNHGGGAGEMAGDYAIPEVLGDFNSDGNLDSADVRYFADGLAIDPATGKLNRQLGFTNVDNAYDALTDSNNFFGTALMTSKAYEAGDSRADIAGNVQRRGWAPTGADGMVDMTDILYVRANYGDWSDLSQAVNMDLSADMNGDLVVNDADVADVIEDVLGSLFGDADWNGTVDLADLAILATNWNQAGDWQEGDFTFDGNVDLADLAILATNWNQAGTMAGSFVGSGMSFDEALGVVGLPAVPEPATLSLLGLGALALVRRRRR